MDSHIAAALYHKNRFIDNRLHTHKYFKLQHSLITHQNKPQRPAQECTSSVLFERICTGKRMSYSKIQLKPFAKFSETQGLASLKDLRAKRIIKHPLIKTLYKEPYREDGICLPLPNE